MAYRKINYSPECLERRKAYQARYMREKHRTPEGRAKAKERWAKLAAKIPEEVKKERQRDANFRYRAKKMGVDPDAVIALLELGCMICGKTQMRGNKMRTLVMDHDHITGLFRGILCSGCNTGIGRFDDDPRKLERALKYLRGEA